MIKAVGSPSSIESCVLLNLSEDLIRRTSERGHLFSKFRHPSDFVCDSYHNQNRCRLQRISQYIRLTHSRKKLTRYFSNDNITPIRYIN